MNEDINLTETVSCSMSQETGTPVQECEFKANYMTGNDNSLEDLEIVSEEQSQEQCPDFWALFFFFFFIWVGPAHKYLLGQCPEFRALSILNEKNYLEI